MSLLVGAITLLKGTTSSGASGLPFWALAADAAASIVPISTKALPLFFFLPGWRMTTSLTKPAQDTHHSVTLRMTDFIVLP